jgi:hypothetical protein
MTTLLGIRGTDVAMAALKCSETFGTTDIQDAYHRVRSARGDAFNKHWQAGIRNEMQRLSSDCQEFAGVDLFAFRRKGIYSFRDGLRPKLIDAANELQGGFFGTRLLVPEDRIILHEQAINHLVGRYAQDKLMQVMKEQGYEIMEDSSQNRAYDFLFRARERGSVPQIMESKGTRSGGIDVSLTPNELKVLAENYHAHWLGFVCNIQIENGEACGGSDPMIVKPPVLERLRFVNSVRLRVVTLPSRPGLLL